MADISVCRAVFLFAYSFPYSGAFYSGFLCRRFSGRVFIPVVFFTTASVLIRLHPISSAKVQPYTSLTVSLAIASSSFVGITITVVLLSGVEITISSPRFAFAS